MTKEFDVLGIGFGPANIALAVALAEEAPDLSHYFLEARPAAEWQPGMLLPGTDIQNNPIRDLATLRNPKSSFTFVNYLFEEGRLLHYLNLPAHFPPRLEYARYIRWVADKFTDVVDYGAEVADISARIGGQPYYLVTTGGGRRYRARALVLGTGRPPYIPDSFASELGDRVFHSTDYLDRKRELFAERPVHDIAVVGSSQSAAEITQDLHASHPGLRIHCVMRGFGYRLKDTSPFSEEAFFPDFTAYYFKADATAKADLDRQLRGTNYSCADRDVIDQLYWRRYEDELLGEERLLLHNNREITEVRNGPDRVTLGLRGRHTGEHSQITVDAVVLATGFRDLGSSEPDEKIPRLLAPLGELLPKDDDEVLHVERDYAVPLRDANLGPVFLNGLCENTHGLGDAGSFSLLSLRAKTIVDGLRSRLDPRATPSPRVRDRARVEDRVRMVFGNRIIVLSPPRSGSTAVARVLWNHPGISHHCHEPFEARYWGNGLDEVPRILNSPLDLGSGQRVPLDTLSEAAGLLIKDMTFQVDQEALEALGGLATHPLVFVMRHPRSCIVSRLRIVRELYGATTFRAFESGWESLRDQIALCRELEIPYVLVDSDELRAAPAETARQLCAAVGLPHTDGLTEWSPRMDLKLCAPGVGALMSPLREHDDPFYRRVLGSSGIESADERDEAAELEAIHAAGLSRELGGWTEIYTCLQEDVNTLRGSVGSPGQSS